MRLLVLPSEVKLSCCYRGCHVLKTARLDGCSFTDWWLNRFNDAYLTASSIRGETSAGRAYGPFCLRISREGILEWKASKKPADSFRAVLRKKLQKMRLDCPRRERALTRT